VRCLGVVSASLLTSTDNAVIVAQATGLTPALCEPESAFQSALSVIRRCITSEADLDDARSFPELDIFIEYCNSADISTPNATSTSATVIDGVTYIGGTANGLASTASAATSIIDPENYAADCRDYALQALANSNLTLPTICLGLLTIGPYYEDHI
jgi:hypothetical protein